MILENESQEISYVLEDLFIAGFFDIAKNGINSVKMLYRKGFWCKNFRIPAITQWSLL